MNENLENAKAYLYREVIPVFQRKADNAKNDIEYGILQNDGSPIRWGEIVKMAVALLACSTPDELLATAQKWLGTLDESWEAESDGDETGFFDEAYAILSQIFYTLGRRDLAPYELDGDNTSATDDGTDIPSPAPSASQEWAFLNNAPGMVGDMARHIVAAAPVPQPMFALASALTTCGTLFGRKVRTVDDNRTNIFALLLGEAGCGKNEPQQFPGAVSYAACASELVAGEVSSDAAVESVLAEQPSLLFSIDEVGHFFAAAKGGEKAATPLSSVIGTFMKLGTSANTVYRGKGYADRKTRRAVVLDQPNVCLLGATTPTQFEKALGQGDVETGFLPRFLVFPAVRRKAAVRKDRVEIPEKIVEYVSAWHDFKKDEAVALFKKCSPIPLRYSPGAERMLDEFSKFCDERAEADDARKTRSIWLRQGEMARRVALVAATSRHSPDEIEEAQIAESDARWAIDLVSFLMHKEEAMLEDAFCTSFTEKWKRELVRIIKVFGKAGAKPSEVTRKSQGLVGKQRRELLNDLVEGGEIQAVQNDKGRIIVYRA